MTEVPQLNFDAIFDTHIFGVVLFNQKLDILKTNSGADEMLFQSELVDAKNLMDLVTEKSLAYIQETIKSDTPFHESFNIRTKVANQLITVDVIKTLLGGKLVWIAFLKDISKQFRLQRKVKLQAEQNKEIEIELEKQQELSDLKSRFISIASHEFKTPLSGISSSVHLVKRYLDADQAFFSESKYSEKINSHIEKMNASIKSLDLILDQFLSLSRLQDGSLKFNYQHLNIRAFLYDIIAQLSPITKTGQNIHLNFTGEEFFDTDRDIFRVVINNIVSNSIKYSGEKQAIFIKAKHQEESLLIEIKDSGIGIPKNEQDKVFTRFFRASNVTDIKGTGLGLNIIKRYVESLNGQIWLESEENVGTSFYIKLPSNTHQL